MTTIAPPLRGDLDRTNTYRKGSKTVLAHLQANPDRMVTLEELRAAYGYSPLQIQRFARYLITQDCYADNIQVLRRARAWSWIERPARAAVEPANRVKAVRGTEEFGFWELSGNPLADYSTMLTTLRAAYEKAHRRLAEHDPALGIGETRPVVQLCVVIPVTG